MKRFGTLGGKSLVRWVEKVWHAEWKGIIVPNSNKLDGKSLVLWMRVERSGTLYGKNLIRWAKNVWYAVWEVWRWLCAVCSQFCRVSSG